MVIARWNLEDVNKSAVVAQECYVLYVFGLWKFCELYIFIGF